jgi:hypothetical protein
VTNQLLARLARADLRLLEPHLETVDLPVRKQLQARDRRVERVYFPDSGIASVVANHDTPIEVGMIGRDGTCPTRDVHASSGGRSNFGSSRDSMDAPKA